jgi:hypothetical protein
VDRVLPQVTLYFGGQAPIPYFTFFNPSVGAVTINNDQYYKKMLPPKNDQNSIPLIGHETTHSLDYAGLGNDTTLFLYFYFDKFLHNIMGGSPDAYKGIGTELRGWSVQDTISEFAYLFPMFLKGQCPERGKRGKRGHNEYRRL